MLHINAGFLLLLFRSQYPIFVTACLPPSQRLRLPTRSRAFLVHRCRLPVAAVAVDSHTIAHRQNLPRGHKPDIFMNIYMVLARIKKKKKYLVNPKEGHAQTGIISPEGIYSAVAVLLLCWWCWELNILFIVARRLRFFSTPHGSGKLARGCFIKKQERLLLHCIFARNNRYVGTDRQVGTTVR